MMKIENKPIQTLDMELTKLKSGPITWKAIRHPDADAISYLREHYRFHPLDYEDVLSHNQRSKIDRYPDYVFLVLLFPVYNTDTKEIIPVEVDFFITRETIITIAHDRLRPLDELIAQCEKNAIQREHLLGTSVEHAVVELLSRLFVVSFPLLDSINMSIESIEHRIFEGEERAMVEEILITRRSVTDLRRIVQGHKKVLEKLINDRSTDKLFRLSRMDAYFDNVLDYAKEVWDALNGHKEAIETLQETNESLISSRLNRVMRMLTVISVVLLPVSVIGTLFGVNAKHAPFIGEQYDFWIIVGLSILTMISMVILLRTKKWM